MNSVALFPSISTVSDERAQRILTHLLLGSSTRVYCAVSLNRNWNNLWVNAFSKILHGTQPSSTSTYEYSQCRRSVAVPAALSVSSHAYCLPASPRLVRYHHDVFRLAILHVFVRISSAKLAHRRNILRSPVSISNN